MSPAAFALREFRSLQATAPKAIKTNRVTRDEAEDKLQCWLAIAIRAGADLPEIEHLLAECRTCLRYPGAIRAAVPEDEARAFLAMQIRPAEAWVPVLAEARNRATEQCDKSPEARQRALDMIDLAEMLGVTLSHCLAAYQREHEAAVGRRQAA